MRFKRGRKTPPSAGPIAFSEMFPTFWSRAHEWANSGNGDPARKAGDALEQYVMECINQSRALNATAPAEGGRDTERFDWFFGPANKIEAMGEYFVGVQNKWSLGEWRAFCDRWMSAARAAEGKS